MTTLHATFLILVGVIENNGILLSLLSTKPLSPNSSIQYLVWSYIYAKKP